MNPSLDLPPTRVRAHFAPHTDGLVWRCAPGGFSGARVWRGEAAGAEPVALKAWPPGTEPDRLDRIHAWVRRVEHLPFIPGVLRGAGQSTVLTDGERVWDCCRWMPGEPHPHPTPVEVATACAAVAQLHDSWSAEAIRGPCPGVQNRLRILAENEPLLRAGPRALPPVSPALDPLLRRAVEVVGRFAPRAARVIEPWGRSATTLHPCVRDLRSAHVLFWNDRIGGIIDFGAAAVDHAAVDLARLLGDYALGDDALFSVGVRAYRRERPSSDAPEEFVRALAVAGAACSVLGWLVRLVVRREPVLDPVAVSARLTHLLVRLGEAFPRFG